MQAIGYIRWSTLEQGNSDRSSEERQRSAIEAFCDAQGWPVAETLVDSGRSAFTGANLTKGELGAFTNRVLSSAIDPRETVLVVEELDRLSRRPPGEMTSWMMPLLMAGLTIAVTNTGQIVTADKVNNDFGSFVSLMSAGFSAFEFSRKQQARGAGSWEKRRRVWIEEGRTLSRHRGRKWLEWDAVAKEFVPIQERVEIIREMFRRRIAGVGKGTIAKWLNEHHEPWQSTTKAPQAWTISAVARIVQDPAVMGFIQFHRNPRGAETKSPIGEPVKVYPAIIDEETFARANDERLVQQLKAQGRGRAVSNLFGPLAKCKACGGTMQPLGSSRYRINKDGSKSQHYFLYCQTAKMTKGQGCDNLRGWPYALIETHILERLLPLALDDQYFRANNDDVVRLEGGAAILRRRIQDAERSASKMLAIVRDTDGDDDEMALTAYHDARARLKGLRADLDALMIDLAEAQGKTTPAGHTVRVADIQARMQDDHADVRFDARTLAKQALKGLIETIWFDPAKGGASVHLRHGLGLMTIRDDGSSMLFNLHKEGSKASAYTAADRAEIVAYEGRVKLVKAKVSPSAETPPKPKRPDSCVRSPPPTRQPQDRQSPRPSADIGRSHPDR